MSYFQISRKFAVIGVCAVSLLQASSVFADTIATFSAVSAPTKVGCGSAQGSIYVQQCNGYIENTVNFSVAGTYTIMVGAYGNYAGSAWPKMQIRIDQISLATISVSSATLKYYSISANISAGAHKIEVAFTNDYYKNGEDRNLYLGMVTVTGSPGVAPSPTPTSTSTSTPSPVQTFVPAGAVWKYLDNGSYPGYTWIQNGFSDSGWAFGSGQLGYGDGDEATVVSYGSDSMNKYITTYFRRSFYVSDAAAIAQLAMGLKRDDGAVVYLNGIEAARSNMPSGSIGPSTLASTRAGGTDESTYFSYNLDPRLLVNGSNVIAVEVHQNGPESSDISFDLELIGYTSSASPSPSPTPLPSPSPVISASPTPSPTGSISWQGPITITSGGTYSGNWESQTRSPAIWIATSEPVIIQNSNIRSRGNLIGVKTKVNLTIRNSNAYGLNPMLKCASPGRFIDADTGFSNLVIENNFISGTRGINVQDNAGAAPLKIRFNKIRNIDGRISTGADGANGYYYPSSLSACGDPADAKNADGTQDEAQFIQLNKVTTNPYVDIGWNEVINDIGLSRVEDNISIYASSGTSTGRINIHDNFIQGAYPLDPSTQNYSGGGIIVGDAGGNYALVSRNTVISSVNYGISVWAASNVEVADNRTIKSGKTPSGIAFGMNSDAGIHVGTASSVHGNTIAWASSGNPADGMANGSASTSTNTVISTIPTLTQELNEYNVWLNKVGAAGVKVGP